MGRKTVAASQDHIVRCIAAVKKAGIEIKTVRIEPDGAVVINGDDQRNPAKEEVRKVKAWL